MTRLVVPVRASPCTSAHDPSVALFLLQEADPVTDGPLDLLPGDGRVQQPPPSAIGSEIARAARPIRIHDRAFPGRCMTRSVLPVERPREVIGHAVLTMTNVVANRQERTKSLAEATPFGEEARTTNTRSPGTEKLEPRNTRNTRNRT